MAGVFDAETEKREALEFEADTAKHSDWMLYQVRVYISTVSNRNPNLCSCKGTGWISSQYDTWEICPFHHRGQPHPELAGYELAHKEQIGRKDPFWKTPEGISLLKTAPRKWK